MKLPTLLAAVMTLAAGCAFAASGADDAFCAALSRRLDSVSMKTCKSARLENAGAQVSTNGRPLFSRDVFHPSSTTTASLGKDKRPPRVLLIGGIHGDELAAVSIIFRWLPAIEGAEGRDIHWRVIPAANPDGLLATPPTRTNARGVDLNRNFASADWLAHARNYWAARTRKDPRRNPGGAPASEAETQWLQRQIEEFQPDAIVSIHAPYGVLDFDGPNDLHPTRFGHLRLNRLGVYPGSLGNYSGVDRNTPVITLEFPSSRAMPSPQELRKVWTDMLQWVHQTIPPRG